MRLLDALSRRRLPAPGSLRGWALRRLGACDGLVLDFVAAYVQRRLRCKQDTGPKQGFRYYGRRALATIGPLRWRGRVTRWVDAAGEGLAWDQRLELQLLRREADTLLKRD